METGLNLAIYDFVVISIFLLFIGRGLWVGFLAQVTVFIALYVSYLAASRYHDNILPFLRDLSDNPQIVFLVAYALLFVCTYVITMLLGKGLGKVVQMTIAGWFDRFLGGVIGFGKAFILVVLLHMLLVTFLAPGNKIINGCQVCPYLSVSTEWFRDIIKDQEIKEAFMEKQPAITEQLVKPFVETPVFGENNKDKKTEGQ